jgi:hypothetical protein
MSTDIEKSETEDMDWESKVVFDTPVDQWSTIDLYKLVKARRQRGITEQTFDLDIKRWNHSLSNLPKYDAKAIGAEIRKMDFSCPANEHDFSKLEIRYSQLVGHLVRLNQMFSEVNWHVLILDGAYKNLRAVSSKLSTGTAKDKEANSEFIVQPFYERLVKAKALLIEIDDSRKSIEFSSMNLNRILKDREPERRMSGNMYNREGQLYSYENAMEQEVDEEGFISTRKKSS